MWHIVTNWSRQKLRDQPKCWLTTMSNFLRNPAGLKIELDLSQLDAESTAVWDYKVHRILHQFSNFIHSLHTAIRCSTKYNFWGGWNIFSAEKKIYNFCLLPPFFWPVCPHFCGSSKELGHVWCHRGHHTGGPNCRASVLLPICAELQNQCWKQVLVQHTSHLCVRALF